jgi:hypothetical protein
MGSLRNLKKEPAKVQAEPRIRRDTQTQGSRLIFNGFCNNYGFSVSRIEYPQSRITPYGFGFHSSELIIHVRDIVDGAIVNDLFTGFNQRVQYDGKFNCMNKMGKMEVWNLYGCFPSKIEVGDAGFTTSNLDLTMEIICNDHKVI